MVRKQFSTIAAVLLVLSASTALGQERTEEQCHQLHPEISSPVELVACTSDIEGSRRALASAHAKLRAHIPEDYQSLLDKAQQAWTAHRDAQCAYEADGYLGNTASSSGMIACTAIMNRERAKYLMDDLNNRWPE